jgi:hypothetical protein
VGRGVDGAEAARCLAQELPPITAVDPTISAANWISALEHDLDGGADPKIVPTSIVSSLNR